MSTTDRELLELAKEAMSNADLIERLNIKAGVMENGERIAWGSDTALMREAADALAAADKRIAELEKYGRVQDPLADRIAELERKLSVAREAMQNLVNVKGRYHTEQAYNRIVEALAQIGGDE